MVYFFMVLVWFLFLIMADSMYSASADLSEVVELSTLHETLSIGCGSSGQMA